MTDKTYRMESDKGKIPYLVPFFVGGGDEKNMVLASEEEANAQARLWAVLLELQILQAMREGWCLLMMT